jgi:hypothetical protein
METIADIVVPIFLGVPIALLLAEVMTRRLGMLHAYRRVCRLRRKVAWYTSMR